MGFEEWIENLGFLSQEARLSQNSNFKLESKPKKEIKNIQKNVICDNSQKNVSSDDTPKNGHADDRVRRLTEKQRELREHIDEEFIDINAYMLELVEGKQKQ